MGKRANGEGSVYRQKNGLWAASVTIGRNAETGRLMRKYVYGKTQQEAREKKDALLEQLKGGIAYFDADKLMVGEWTKTWLETHARRKVRANTYSTYESSFLQHIEPTLGKIRLQKLQASQIQKMVNQIAERSPRAAQYAFAVLRMAVKQALKEDLLAKAPTLAVTPPKIAKKEVRQLTADEWERLFTEAKKSGLYLAVLLVWATGMRREEILGLRWTDINWKTKALSIANVVIVTKEGPQFAPPKSKSGYRQIPIPPQVIAALKKAKALNAEKKVADSDWNKENLVFCTKDGGPIDPRRFSHMFSDTAKAANVPYTFHDLRHDHATRLFEAGWHPKDVQDRLGHSNISMTMDTYTHHVPARQKGIADWLKNTLPKSAQ